jgi:hypothetical protein
MRSIQKVVHEEQDLGGSPVSLGSLAHKYGVKSLGAMIAAHDAVRNRKVGPFEFDLLFNSKAPAALGISAKVTVNPDGSVQWEGQARDTGIDGYDFSTSAIVRSSANFLLAFNHTGHVAPFETKDWTTVITPPFTVPRNRLSEFEHGQIQSNTEYESDIGSLLEKAVDWLLKFSVGTALGPFGAVVFVGLEAGSLISTGSLVPGAKIVEGILWMAGPLNTLFAIAAEGIVSAGSQTQDPLRKDVYDWANDQEVFGGSLPPRDMLVLTDTIGGGNRPFTFPRFDGKITLNFGPQGFPDPRKYNEPKDLDNGFLRGTNYNKALVGSDGKPHAQLKKSGEVLIHELVHACQIHKTADLSYLAGGLAAKLCEAGGNSPYRYGPPTIDYTSLGIEQQAQIISDWWAGGVPDGCPQTGIPKDPNSPYFHYLTNLRGGLF